MTVGLLIKAGQVSVIFRLSLLIILTNLATIVGASSPSDSNALELNSTSILNDPLYLGSGREIDIKFDDAQHDWKDDSNILFTKDEYVNYITAYDQPFIIFLTNKYIHLYRVIAGNTLKNFLNYKHNVPNMYHEYVYGYCTHGYLAVLKQNSLHFFKFNDDRTDFVFQKVYPASLFGVSGFTAITGVNAWNNTVLVKSNNSEVYYLDFRQPLKPLSHKLPLPEKNEDIIFVKTVDLGFGGAVCYPHSLELFNLISGERYKGFYFLDEVLYLNYDQGSNNIVMLMKGKPYAIVVNTSPDTGFRRTHIEIQASNYLKLKLLRLGQAKLALLESKMFSLVNFAATDWQFSFGETLARLPMPASVNNFDFMMTYRQSNLVLINRKDTQGNMVIRHLRMKTSRNSLCHPSCHGRCQYPFVVCSQKPWVVISFITGTFLVGLTLAICNRILRTCEKAAQKKREKSIRNQLISQAMAGASFVQKTSKGSVRLFWEEPYDLRSSFMREDTADTRENSRKQAKRHRGKVV